MEIKNIPNPVLPDWVKLYNTYDPEYYAPGKRVSAEEWNTLFLASVRQGNYNADTLELLIKTYLPETYLTKTDFNMFSAQMQDEYNTFTETTQNQYSAFTTQIQQDFTNLTEEVNSLEDRVIKAEDVAYALDDVIQEANSYAKQAYDLSEVAKSYSETAVNTANSAVNTANSAVDIATESNTTSQTALENSQSAINTANNASTAAAQAVSTANAASLRSEDAIATANAAKVESASAKNTATNAENTAANAVNTAESATVLSEDAKRIAQNALDLVTEGQGSQVLVGGVAVATFDADTKADLDYVDRQIAALVGAAPETLDTLEELATAFEENADVVKTLEAAIVTKVAKTDVEDFLSTTSTNPVQNKVLYNPVTFAESERQKSKNLLNPQWLKQGAYVFINGNFSYDTTYVTTEKISVKPNSQIVASSNIGIDSDSGFVFFNNDVYVGYSPDANTTVPSNANQVVFNFHAIGITPASLTTPQLEYGSVATDFQPYNGAIVRDKQLNERLSNYLPLAGGKMTGRISFADGNVALPETDDLQFITGIESYAAGGGMIYTHRDKFKQKLLQTNGAIIKGRAYNSGDDEGLIIERASNNCAGLCLGSPTGARSVHYLMPDNSAIWRWSNGSSSYDISHPQKAGTIALTSDIPSGIITESTAYREFATLLPKKGTVINNGADLNSIEYLKVGNYYQSGTANTSNMTNIPMKEAFMMTVYAPLSSAYDDESTNIWCYRIRCFMTLAGDRWWQFCYTSGTAGVWSYGPWHREIHGNGGEITGTLTISGSINLIV